MPPPIPPGAAVPPGRQARMDRRAARQAQPPGVPKPPDPNTYQGFTAHAQNIQATPTAFEQGVLDPKYLDVKNDPYLKGAASALQRDWREELGRGISGVMSPFQSGATLGGGGIAAATGARYANEGLEDLNDQLAKSYFGAHEAAAGRQVDVSGQLSGRTNQLVGAASSAYGADRDFQGRIKTAKIAANSALQQARMAQQLGYDQLASDLMIKYEQLQQQAFNDEREYALRYGQLTGNILGQFGSEEQRQTGPGMSTTGGFLQGAAGGALTGYGLNQQLGIGQGQSNLPIIT